jgi:hypothetical protein
MQCHPTLVCHYIRPGASLQQEAGQAAHFGKGLWWGGHQRAEQGHPAVGVGRVDGNAAVEQELGNVLLPAGCGVVQERFAVVCL